MKRKPIELNGETHKPKIIDFNTCISKSDRTTKQKISKDIEAFNTTSNQCIIGIYRTLHQTIRIYYLVKCPQNIHQ